MFLIDDFLQAWRGLRHSPAFLFLASAVLALGLGATIFTYGVLNTTSMRPPPFPDAGRLHVIFGAEPARDEPYLQLHYLDFLEYKAQQRSFEDIAAGYTGTMMISGDRPAERYNGGFVSWNLMKVLGVKPLLGRDFTEDDDLPDATPTVILGHELWTERYHQDPGVIGRVVRVNARPSIVIGVMPKGFSFPSNEALWVPMQRDPALERRGDQNHENMVGVTAVGRLAKGVTREQAAHEAREIFDRLARLYPRSNAGVTAAIVTVAEGSIGDTARTINTMFAAVLLVLLISCANVASLIFVRANMRVYEAGMRAALGARRPRLIMQMLGESIIVSFFGVIGGLVLAALGLHFTNVAVHNLSEAKTPIWWTFPIDWNVALFAAGVALASALLSGIVPALRASRPDVMRILRDGGRTGTGMRLNKFTTAMVIVEVAFSAALLTGAGLMTRASVLSLQQDFGADVRGFMSERVGLPFAKYPTHEQQGAFFERLLAELREKPGVRAAIAATNMPGVGADEWRLAIEGETYDARADYPVAHGISVSAGFFEGFRLRMKAGREFHAGDTPASTPVAVVNEAFVDAYFPDEDPIGRTLRAAEDPSSAVVTIVGVAPNINHDKRWKNGTFAPTIYRPLAQLPWRFATVAIRVDGDPHAYGDMLRAVTQSLDPDLAPYWIQTLEEFQVQRRDAIKLLSNVFIAFALIAIILAAVGIYGVLAFATGQRNREIGVRRAMGAQDKQILATVMRGALFQLAIGLALGALFAPIMARSLKDGLLGMSPDDPVIYSMVLVILLTATLLASWIPARRALRIQPSSALRCE